MRHRQFDTHFSSLADLTSGGKPSLRHTARAVLGRAPPRFIATAFCCHFTAWAKSPASAQAAANLTSAAGVLPVRQLARSRRRRDRELAIAVLCVRARRPDPGQGRVGLHVIGISSRQLFITGQGTQYRARPASVPLRAPASAPATARPVPRSSRGRPRPVHTCASSPRRRR